ncbi:MAG: putative sugar nucleotidyl transferase [Candidatus Zixiibacteriota bacterium]
MANSISICLFEDPAFVQFLPLTHLRPVFLLRSGIVPLFKRVERHFPQADICFSSRDHIAPLLAEQLPDYPVNIIKQGEDGLLFLNGRIRDYGNLPELVIGASEPTLFRSGDKTIAWLIRPNSLESAPSIATQHDYQKLFDGLTEPVSEEATTATLYDHLWELVEDIGRETVADYSHLQSTLPDPHNVRFHDGATLVREESIYLSNDVEIMPASVIDASGGPVYIDTNTRVEPHAAIFGPCYIGPNCVILAGKVSGSSIGHTCRVGGEVEESIFQSYVNKYHAGFIGHSYVGSWVNFGAMTTNSDLKNNYSTIRVTIGGDSIDSRSIKVGSFIGDHTKFGIGTLLNTGIHIGVACNLFGGTLIRDKEVPSFSWGDSDNLETYRFDKAIETAQRTCERRRCRFSDHEQRILEAISKGERNDSGVMRL